jgi:uridine kinase
MSNTPTMIGIAGGSCSGKSSIAARLSTLVGGGLLVLGLDSYYHDFSGVPEDEIEVDVPEALDHALLVGQLTELRRGRAVEKPVYDYTTHTRRVGGGLWVDPTDYVVLEGLFALYWPEVRDLLDLCVFVTIDHETALMRRIERDVRERARTEASVRTQYNQKVRPNFERLVEPTMGYADLVVNGLEPVELSARAVLDHLPPLG